MLKTLAGKHHSTAAKMARKHKTAIDTPYGRRVCFEARVERDGRKPLTARFGGMPLHRKKDALTDRVTDPGRAVAHGKELIQRFLAGTCELCGSTSDIEVHHIRKLASLGRPGQPRWADEMQRRHRKTLILCGNCHATAHNLATTQ